MIVFLIINLRKFGENNIFQSILRLDTDYRKKIIPSQIGSNYRQKDQTRE